MLPKCQAWKPKKQNRKDEAQLGGSRGMAAEVNGKNPNCWNRLRFHPRICLFALGDRKISSETSSLLFLLCSRHKMIKSHSQTKLTQVASPVGTSARMKYSDGVSHSLTLLQQLQIRKMKGYHTKGKEHKTALFKYRPKFLSDVNQKISMDLISTTLIQTTWKKKKKDLTSCFFLGTISSLSQINNDLLSFKGHCPTLTIHSTRT